MRGMILAAGRGTRMGELTKETPKPLLKVGKYFLIEYALNSLVKLGITEIVINISYLGEKIKKTIGDGKRYGVTIQYSIEEEPLETGGGIYQALPLLGPDPFVVVSGDVISHYSLTKQPNHPQKLAHLVLVNNPDYHPTGDFCLMEEKVFYGDNPTFTFANIGFYRPELFANCKPGKFRLATVLAEAITKGKVTGEHYKGVWHNLGTAEELNKVIEFPDMHF